MYSEEYGGLKCPAHTCARERREVSQARHVCHVCRAAGQRLVAGELDDAVTGATNDVSVSASRVSPHGHHSGYDSFLASTPQADSESF